MNIRSIAIAVTVLVVVGAGLLIARVAHAQASKDAQVISQLKKAGSDLSRPHPIDFYLYFPTREAADRVASKVRALGCSIKRVDRAAVGTEWLVLATKTMVPAEAELRKLRKEFESLANIEKGEYDGWETQVVK